MTYSGPGRFVPKPKFAVPINTMQIALTVGFMG